jgi:hypothetical protein
VTQTQTERLHIIEGTVWKDAVISLLDSRSRYRPWRCGFGEAHMGDPVAIVLNTDPPSVLTEMGTLGADGRPDIALIRWTSRGPGLVDLTTLAVMGDLEQDARHAWQLRGDAAIQMELALNECSYRCDRSMRLGHSSIAEARILLHSQGRCTGCGDDIDLVAEDARDLYIHTVDAPSRDASQPIVRTETDARYCYDPIPDSCWLERFPADWPGVLCKRCPAWMQEEGHTSLLDFRFARHPKCPRCRAVRTRRALYGLLLTRDLPPWLEPRGCVETGDHLWTCAACGLEW